MGKILPPCTLKLWDVETKYMKLYQDMRLSFNHLNSSVDYYEQVIKPNFLRQDEIDTAKFVEIKKARDLLDQNQGSP